MRLIPSKVLLNAVFPVTLLWSEFSRRIPFSPLLHTVLFTSLFQLDPLTSIPFHPLLQTLFWVTLFPAVGRVVIRGVQPQVDIVRLVYPNPVSVLLYAMLL